MRRRSRPGAGPAWRRSRFRQVGHLVAEHSNHMVQSDQPDVVIAAIRRVVGLENRAVTQQRPRGSAPWTPAGQGPDP